MHLKLLCGFIYLISVSLINYFTIFYRVEFNFDNYNDYDLCVDKTEIEVRENRLQREFKSLTDASHGMIQIFEEVL